MNFFLPRRLLQIHPLPELQEVVHADQRGEVDTQEKRRRETFFFLFFFFLATGSDAFCLRCRS